MDIFVAEFDKVIDPTGVRSIDEDGIVNTQKMRERCVLIKIQNHVFHPLSE